jgi:hypothetical protein
MHIQGIPGVVLEVPGLGQTVPEIFRKMGQEIAGEQKEGGALTVAVGKIFLQATGIGLKIENDVQHSPKNGKKHYKKNPGKLVGRFFFFIDDIHTNYNAHHIQRPAHIPEIFPAAGEKVQYKRYLQKQDDDDKNPPPEHNPEPFFLFHLKSPPSSKYIIILE